MLTLREDIFSKASLPVSTSWLLADCMEFRGKQDLWSQSRPEVLEALRRRAIVQSIESSNRIEGVTVSPERLAPLALGNAKPRDRSEEEISGYRRALEWIFSRKSAVPIDLRTILHLHAVSQSGAGDAGKLKTRDHEIIEILPGGERHVRFKPTPAKETSALLTQLCDSYQRLEDASNVPSLLLISTMVFDFLCIHPFRDGNGRASRLLTTLLLSQHGFSLTRYVSLERLVEDSREDYYRTLGESSRGWQEGRNPILPWWNYFLGVVRRGYEDLSRQAEGYAGQPVKSEMIRRMILARIGAFSLADVHGQLPGVSRQLIKKVLAELKAAGKVSTSGRGRGAKWLVRIGG